MLYMKIFGFASKSLRPLGTTCLMSSFPTTVTATSVRGMVLEVMARTEVFNAFKRGRAAIMKVTGNGVEVA